MPSVCVTLVASVNLSLDEIEMSGCTAVYLTLCLSAWTCSYERHASPNWIAFTSRSYIAISESTCWDVPLTSLSSIWSGRFRAGRPSNCSLNFQSRIWGGGTKAPWICMAGTGITRIFYSSLGKHFPGFQYRAAIFLYTLCFSRPILN